MKKIIPILEQNEAFKSFIEGKKDIVVNELYHEALLLAGAFLKHPKNTVIVVANQYQANELYQYLVPLVKSDVAYFPVDESFRVETLASSPETLIERVSTMHSLCDTKPKILICHIHSALRYVPSKERFIDTTLTITKGMQLDIFDLQKQLVNLGYHHTSKVDQPFYFAKRGGVIDVYSVQYDMPIRIEFFDDEVDDIRFFDKDNQRTVEHCNEIAIIPAGDVIYDESQVDEVCDKIDKLYSTNKVNDDALEEIEMQVSLDKEALQTGSNDFSIYGYLGLFNDSTSIISYLDNPKIIFSSINEVHHNYKQYIEENFYYHQELSTIGRIILGLPWVQDIYSVFPDKYQEIKKIPTKKTDQYFLTQSVIINKHTEVDVFNSIKEYVMESDVLIVLEDQHYVRQIIDLLERNQQSFTMIGDQDNIYPGINIYVGQIPLGFSLIEQKITVLTTSDLFIQEEMKKPRYVKYKEAKIIKNYQELQLGDYVVHDSHGIGQYLGIKTLESNGVNKDYLYVSYAGDDTLYIPVEQFKLIRKFASSSGKVPKVHKLGGTQWQKTKQKIRDKVDDIADKLIEIYSKRISQVGFAFNKDCQMQHTFEKAFGYTLTVDQLRSIDEIKADMEKAQPMDRLLCGDVGFGKTEVALRGACKAVLSNKQVAFLCPTTILSMQHYKTTVARFEGMAVNIALLNRFTSSKEKKQILQDVKEGKIDILIGTHRILSKDVAFKDLGFLIVDEEQRFGVGQKEKIKEYRETIDVLVLSATPIPRTLQMSLMNIRGLSQIDTPPLNRMPVQTYVVEKNNMLIKQVIERELSRNGQVFYLYNRTSEIENVAARIAMEIPGAKVVVGHGKMSKEQLEDVMVRFINKEYNVLVCTTIIETGIDIPNANTILIDQADHFGLSQLYQIKGRVGRSGRRAYAYLLYSKQKQMTEIATKRLQAIKEFTELGSGYKIAMRDLALRGAGDILGGQQTGFIDTVGFEMYMKILQDAIASKTDKITTIKKDVPTLNIPVNGYIPKDYVDSDMEKLQVYQRIEKCDTMQSIVMLQNEFLDYYGKLPTEIINLIDKRRLDILASSSSIESITQVNNTIEVIFSEVFASKVDGISLFEEVIKTFAKAQFKTRQNKITIIIPRVENWLIKLNTLLQTVEAQ